MLRRCLETIAVCVALSLPPFFYIINLPLFIFLFYYDWVSRALAFLYLVYLAFDWKSKDTGKGRGILGGSYFVKLIRSYFSMSMESTSTSPYPLDRNYLVGGHPHGYLSFGQLPRMDQGSEEYKNLFGDGEHRFCCTDLAFKTPFLRDIFFGLGGMSVSAKAIRGYLVDSEKGRFLNIMVGGVKEALLMSEKDHRLVLKSRKGFIKMALQTGSDLIPSYAFGETEIWDIYQPPPGTVLYAVQQFAYSKLGVGMPYVKWSWRNMFGVPKRVPITVVYGPAIAVRKVEEPTCEEIKELHGMYVRALVDLFDSKKCDYLHESAQLIIE